MTSKKQEHPVEKSDESQPDDQLPQAKEEFAEVDPKRQIQLRLGRRLRLTRERRGLSLADIASKLRIQKNYLSALEEGDWNRLPEEVYAFGFLRQYARLLNEDIPEELLEYLKAGKYKLTKPFTMPDPPIAPNRIWAIAAGIVFVLLFVLFNMSDNGEDQPQSSVTPSESVSSSARKTAVQKPAPSRGTVEENITAKTPGDHQAVAAAPVSPDETTPTTAVQEEETAPPPVVPAGDMHQYRLSAVETASWIQVHDPEGQLIRDALLQAGQSLKLERSDPYLLLTCGNAAAMRIEVDGVLYAAAGTLGMQGEVIRNFRIEVPAKPPR